MSRVTSKLQVTIPKAIADQYGIEPGAEIEWLPAGDAIRVLPQTRRDGPDDTEWRLRVFDAATERQRARRSGKRAPTSGADRGWRREDLYARGGAG